MQPFCTGKNLANVTIRCTVFVHLKIVLLKVTSEFSFDLFGQCSRKLNPFSRNCVVMQSLTSGYDNTMAASSFPRSSLLLKRVLSFVPPRNCVVMQSLTSGYDNTMAASSFQGPFSSSREEPENQVAITSTPLP